MAWSASGDKVSEPEVVETGQALSPGVREREKARPTLEDSGSSGIQSARDPTYRRTDRGSHVPMFGPIAEEELLDDEEEPVGAVVESLTR